jgi:hypothetical protein
MVVIVDRLCGEWPRGRALRPSSAMPPERRLVPRFAAEPPQDALPYGRWADRLRQELAGAFLAVDGEGQDLGEPGEVVFHPDRSWYGRTWQPVTCRTSTGLDLYGFVMWVVPEEGEEPDELVAAADFSDQLAEDHPEWAMDLCDEEVGSWRGEDGEEADMTLVWGRPMVDGGVTATAELGGVTVDQCRIVEGRFTLIAPDDYRGDTLEVALWDGAGRELARESLYDEDEGDEEDDAVA